MQVHKRTKMKVVLRIATLLLTVVLTKPCCSAAQDDHDEILVETHSGKIRGTTLPDGNAEYFYAFRGIPYAKPPTDDLRFQPPEPVDTWDDILDASRDGAECPQPDLADNEKLIGQEDCLFLNVYTPKKEFLLKNGSNSTKLLPVLVYIHGGGFYFGTGNYRIYGPEKFMDVGVVLVTLNYRLGLLGFMSTEDEHAPGNYGILDIIQALRWIQQNIAKFYGDPSKVTLFGMSAGGASVTYLMLSPLATGLFHAAIAQSGTPLASWSFQQTPLVWTKRIAKQLDCPMETTVGIVDCFRKKPVEDLLKATEKFHRAIMFPMFHSPVVDGKFLLGDPAVLLKDGKVANKVPYITGIVKDEGIAFCLTIVHATSKGQEFPAKGRVFATDFLPLLSHGIEPQMTDVVELIINEYFTGKDVDDPKVMQDAFAELLGDSMFNAGAEMTLRFMARAGVPTYAYLYTHKSPLGMVTSGIFGDPKGDYVAHADELSVQFDFHPVARENKDFIDDVRMSKLINQLWRNFAQTKKPSFEGVRQTGTVPDAIQMNLRWLPYTEDSPDYLELSVTPSMKRGSFSNRTRLWAETIPELVKKHDKHGIKDEL